MFNGIVRDYKKQLNTNLNKNNSLIQQYQTEIENARKTGSTADYPSILDKKQKIEGLRKEHVAIKKDIKSLNE